MVFLLAETFYELNTCTGEIVNASLDTFSEKFTYHIPAIINEFTKTPSDHRGNCFKNFIGFYCFIQNYFTVIDIKQLFPSSLFTNKNY